MVDELLIWHECTIKPIFLNNDTQKLYFTLNTSFSCLFFHVCLEGNITLMCFLMLIICIFLPLWVNILCLHCEGVEFLYNQHQIRQDFTEINGDPSPIKSALHAQFNQGSGYSKGIFHLNLEGTFEFTYMNHYDKDQRLCICTSDSLDHDVQVSMLE